MLLNEPSKPEACLSGTRIREELILTMLAHRVLDLNQDSHKCKPSAFTTSYPGWLLVKTSHHELINIYGPRHRESSFCNRSTLPLCFLFIAISLLQRHETSSMLNFGNGFCMDIYMYYQRTYIGIMYVVTAQSQIISHLVRDRFLYQWWVTLLQGLLELVYNVKIVVSGDSISPGETSLIIMNHRTR